MTTDDHTWGPMHGTLRGSVEAARGRRVHVVDEVYRGRPQVTVFAEFPPAPPHYPDRVVRIVACLDLAAAGELADVLRRAVQALSGAPARPVDAPVDDGGPDHG